MLSICYYSTSVAGSPLMLSDTVSHGDLVARTRSALSSLAKTTPRTKDCHHVRMIAKVAEGPASDVAQRLTCRSGWCGCVAKVMRKRSRQTGNHLTFFAASG